MFSGLKVFKISSIFADGFTRIFVLTPLTEAIMKEPKICGFCYTQIYDVEQEQNGLYTYSRKPKFDMNIFKEINSQIAEIEK